jgi:hypothetical protein
MIAKRHLETADDIRNAHDRRAAYIRSQTQYTADAKAGMLAKNYTDATSQMDDLRRTATGDDAALRTSLERKAFGIADLPGDPATAAVSYRDAQDRVAGITGTPDAHALLARAQRSGDEPLARAVAAHAYDMRGSFDGIANGDDTSTWTSVLQAYIDERPEKARAVQTLLTAKDQKLQSQVTDAWSFIVAKPPELDRYSQVHLQQLADSAP